MSRRTIAFDPQAYGPTVAELLTPAREPPLGPGEPNRGAFAQLKALSTESLGTGQRVVNRSMAEACLAGLWLYHDFLDEAHAISQEIHTPSGSFWHAIVHRREGDYDNAKYWFRRVGSHAVFEPLRTAAAMAASQGQQLDASAGYLVTQGAWDPFRFVDLCRACVGRANPAETSTAALCRNIQSREWQLLFDHCFRAALGEI
jgi:hypothetical protein